MLYVFDAVGTFWSNKMLRFPLDVKLFRRNSNMSSFSVQLSNASGIVEVHCARVVKAASNELERKLTLLGRDEFGFIGGFDENERHH
jgi:hypothetical protein